MNHKLKTWTEYFKEVLSGNKMFEVRKNDRDFQKGDVLVLQEWDKEVKEYTGRELRFMVSYILKDTFFGIRKGYCVMSLKTHKLI